MATLYVTAITSPSSSSSSSSSSCHLQRRRFSTPSSFTLLHELRPFAFNWRKRRTLMCGVSQGAKKAINDTVENDNLIEVMREADPNGDGSRTFLNTLDDKSSEAWSQFAIRVSGEWDGFGADFSNEGKPIELPESVVPEAYREWEVKVFDWQTQCPTLAEPEDHILEYKTIQLLPTVGCEADAATRYNIDERKIGGENFGVTAFAYQSNGSYVAVWQKKDNLLELEYCLINPQDFESRWYGPFRNGEQLGGCAIRDSAFASTAPLIASEVAGIWQGSKAVAAFGTPNTEIQQQLLDDKVQNYVGDGDNIILLPKKLWCSLKQIKDGESLSEVGWLLDNGQAITSSCLFSSTAKLKEISIALQTKALEDV